MADTSSPLAGIRVVEAAQMISAPLATTLLADQGADVIKVEAPAGDRMRGLGDVRNGMGSVFHTCNRGKRSIVIDSKQPDGKDALVRLIRSADVFVQNFRPGAADRMGIGPGATRADNPRLIYVSVSGFGSSGPYADQMVYDFVIQGLTGMAAHEGVDEPRLTKSLVVDKATALTVAQATSAALFHRERTGEGQHLEINMVEAGLQFFWPDGMWHHTLLGDDIQRVPHMAGNYEVRPTADGFITLNLATRSTWARLCEAIDPGLADDPRFATYADRLRNGKELAAAVDRTLSTLTTEEALDRLGAHDVPGGRVVPPSEVHDDPQIRHNQSLVERDSASIGRIRDQRPAARFGGRQSDPAGSAPPLGAHTDEVLAELGYGPAELSSLRAGGSIG